MAFRTVNLQRRDLLVLLQGLLVLAVFLVYSPSLRNGFVWDDDDYIVNNRHVANGLTIANTVWAVGAVYSANWHPLTWISHMLDCSMYGMKPAGHHLSNIVLHAACTIVLMHVLLSFGLVPFASFAGAALFAFHPINVEVVGWVSQRKSLLCMLFALCTLLTYVLYVRMPNLKTYILGFLLYCCALASKPLAVCLPLVMILMDVWPLKRLESMRNRQSPVTKYPFLVAEKAPFFGAAAACCFITLAAQHSKNAIQDLSQISLILRLENIPVSLFSYLSAVFFPRSLCVFYPFPHFFPLYTVVGALLAVMLITAGSVMTIRRHPWFFVGWLWFIITLLPSIGIIQVGDQSHADRYAFMPFVGLLIMLIFPCVAFFQRTGRSSILKGFWVLSFIVIISLLSILSFRQQRYWKDEISLFTRSVTAAGPSALAYNNLGLAYLQKGNCTLASTLLRKAIELSPGYVNTNNLLAVSYAQCGRFPEALLQTEKVLSLDPRYVPALVLESSLLEQSGKNREALAVCQSTIDCGGGNNAIFLRQGILLKKLNRYDEAILAFSTVLKSSPGQNVARYERAEALKRKGDIGSALRDLDILRRTAPDDTSITNFYERCLQEKNAVSSP